MIIEVLKSKIHGAIITGTDLYYEGSIKLSADLKAASRLLAHERVFIFNVTTGARFDTYVLPGDAEPGKVEVNGAAARLAMVGDQVIIVSYGSLDIEEAVRYQPTIVIVGPENRPT